MNTIICLTPRSTRTPTRRKSELCHILRRAKFADPRLREFPNLRIRPAEMMVGRDDQVAAEAVIRPAGLEPAAPCLEDSDKMVNPD
jgi:hypothetical protein